MKTKRILSVTLIMALVLSLFTGIMPIVSAEPTNPDFVSEKYYFDFSQYAFDTVTVEDRAANLGYNGNTVNAYSATVNCGVWSLEEDDTATGGKYLKYVKDNNGSGTSLSNFLFVANPTGDYSTKGNHIVLDAATTYNIKIRYKVEDLEEEKYDLNLFAVATTTVGTPNDCPAANLVYIQKGLGNTNGWVEATYKFTTPASYTGTVNSLLLGFNPATEGTTNRPSAGTLYTYSVAIDYVEIQKPEFAAQHMNIDFDDFVITPFNGNNIGTVYTSTTNPNLWVIGNEDNNKFIQFPYNTAGARTSPGSAFYAFMANPTGSGDYKGDQAGLAFILENGGEYRISFKYRLSSLASGGTMTFKVGATGSMSCCNATWSEANQSIALTPEDGTSSISLGVTSEWKTMTYTFKMSTTSATARRSMQVAFVPNLTQLKSTYTLDVDDVVVDRLATVTIKDEAGNTATQKGAPAAPIGTLDMGGNTAEAVDMPVKAEVYSGTTAQIGEYKYYSDKDLTKEITSYTFNSVNETIYSKFIATTSNANQVAFCGFDEYKLRTKSYDDATAYGDFVGMGYLNGTNEHVWDIVDTEAYSGTKSMHMALASGYDASRRYLYIGNGYEWEDNASYQVSLRIKKDAEIEQNGFLKINLGGGGNIYGAFIYGQNSSEIMIPADELSSEWTEITFAYNYIPQKITKFPYSIDYYAGPTLFFTTDTDSNVAIYLDAITISKVCGDIAAETIDINNEDNKQEVRVTSSYLVNDSNKVLLAGVEYDVVERGILAKASTNTVKLLEGNDGVLSVKKAENLDDYWADGANGEKIFAMLIEDISVNDHREITARSYVKLSDGNTYYSPLTTFSVGETNAPAGYKLVWGDEFDGTKLDTTKWNTEYTVNPPLYQTKDVISVENGMLNLNVTRHVGSDTSLKYDVPLDLSTSKTMNYQYGYLEVRARVPYQRGLNSAVWLRSNGQISKDAGTKLSDTLAEIDIFETLTLTDRATSNIHKWLTVDSVLSHSQYNSGTGNKIQQYIFDSENLCDEFHIYGFEWTETEIKMYIDRELYATYDITTDYEKNGNVVGDMASFHDPSHIIIGMKPQLAELGAYDYYGDGSGYTTDDTVFETPYSIDWIRLYQKDDTGMLLK